MNKNKDINTLDLYPMQVFCTVAREKSFSRAAEKLFRTQPAISMMVQRLEAELGEKLIDRSGRELLLTDAGRIVLEHARRFENLQVDLVKSVRATFLTHYDATTGTFLQYNFGLRYGTCCWEVSLNFTNRTQGPGEPMERNVTVQFDLKIPTPVISR